MYLNKEFPPKEIKMTRKYLKKCSSSLATRDVSIKTTLTTNAGEDVENKNPHSLLLGMHASVAVLEISVENSQNDKNKFTI